MEDVRALVPKAEDEEVRPRHPVRLPVVVAALATLGLAALGFATLARSGRPGVADGTIAEDVTELAEKRFCSEYPYLKFEMPHPLVYSNLANKGPDHGNGEGMVLKTIDLGQGAGNEFDKEVYMTINGTNSDYRPFSQRLNGMQGKYGSINLKSGSHLDLEFNFFDRASMEQLTMPDLALTFFDLDTGNGGKSKEYVTIGGFTSYHLTPNTEVKVSDGPGGQKRFAASTVGTGEDNPLDPMFLTQQQKNRAVTLLYKNVKTVKATIGAEPGMGPRFFTFVGRPSLLCAVTVQEGFAPPLPDLVAEGELQRGIAGGEDDTFVRYIAFPGQQVKKGDVIAVVRAADGPEYNIVAPYGGKVVSIHDKLKPNDKLKERLDDKTLAIIELPTLGPLPVGGGVVAGGPCKGGIGAPGGRPGAGGSGAESPGQGREMPAHSTFVKYLVEVGDAVREHDSIAVAKDHAGRDFKLYATSLGTVKARQEALLPGDPMAKVPDNDLVTLAPLKPLGPLNDHNAQAAVVPQGSGTEFVEYKVKKGEIIKAGQPVAELKDGQGSPIILKASRGGVVTDLQHLEPGTPIDRVSDRNLCTTGKFAPLSVAPGSQTPTLYTSPSGGAGAGGAGTGGAGASGADAGGAGAAPEGIKFVRFHVKPGDIVEAGAPIATVEDRDGKQMDIMASQSGVVESIQDGLQEGMLLGNVMQDANIATLGQLPSLDVDEEEKGSFAPTSGDWMLDEWKADVGDDVDRGDPVAVLRDSSTGATRLVKAPKTGTVTERQMIREGDIVERVTKDEDLATIGLLEGPEIGFREVGVAVPNMDFKFKRWMVGTGDRVHFGDPIAEVETVDIAPSGSPPTRRLSEVMQIPSPGTGWINYEADLVPGESIGKQTASPNIAKVNLGWPWWLMLLAALMVLCCCFCCLFKVMQKPKPVYKPMPPSPEPVSEPEPAPPKPDGLRLDFDDAGTIRTVYAKWRPLGIKHNYVAPIVAHDFTINSYAKQDLGVKDGWKLTRIGDEELNDNPHFDQVNEKLSNYMKDFPLWPLPLEFRRNLSDSTSTLVKFVERPLGLEFSNVAPIQVGKIFQDSPAAVQGVEKGWYLTKIGEYGCSENHNFREVMKYLKEGVQPLDDLGKKYPTG